MMPKTLSKKILLWAFLLLGVPFCAFAQGSGQFSGGGGGGVTGLPGSPIVNGDYGCLYHVTLGVAVSLTCPQIGVFPRVISGATATDAPSFSDATCVPIVHDKAGSAAVTVTIPTPASLFNPTACIIYENHSANTDTIKATTNTIQSGTSAAVAGATGISVPPGRRVTLTVDTFNATNWLANSVPVFNVSDGLTATSFQSIGTTAGFVDYPQGSTSAAVAPCNTANSICEQAPAAVTSYLVTKPAAAGSGIRLSTNASNVITESFSGDAAHSLTATAQTASITTATLCAATAGTACGQAGQYRLNFYFWGSGTACTSVTAGSVALNVTYTDPQGTTHTTVGFPLWDQSKSAFGTSFFFATALASEAAQGSMIISTNGTIIQYATVYTACTTGTGTYNLRATVEQLQ